MLKPLNDNVIFKEVKKEEKTSSGIILTTGQEETWLCNLAAVGEGIVVDGKLKTVRKRKRKVYLKNLNNKLQIQRWRIFSYKRESILAVLSKRMMIYG